MLVQDEASRIRHVVREDANIALQGHGLRDGPNFRMPTDHGIARSYYISYLPTTVICQWPRSNEAWFHAMGRCGAAAVLNALRSRVPRLQKLEIAVDLMYQLRLSTKQQTMHEVARVIWREK